MTSALRCFVAAMLIQKIQPRHWLQWLLHFNDLEHLFFASDQEWHAAGIPSVYWPELRQINWEVVQKEIAWADGALRHIICYADPDYPPLLKEITDPPLVLYVHGAKQALSYLQVAIVGSRHATSIGRQTAELFASVLVEKGLVVTSGLASGIDGASHRGALSRGGVTIAVMGTGLHTIYPTTHQRLAEEIIAKDGAVISEFPLSTPPLAFHFPRRNRIISGLSRGVLVVEAAIRSGSLVTARHAIEQGREVFAIPGSIHHPHNKGCHHLLRQGAKLVETAADIIEELECYQTLHLPLKSIAKSQKKPTLIPLNEDLLSHIDYEITPMDMILLRSGLTASQVSSILLTLELDGYIRSVSGGYVRLIERETI